MRSLDAIFKEAASRGFQLCNMFQMPDGSYRINFMAGGEGRGFGNSPSPQEAAEIALGHAMAAPVAPEGEEDYI